MKKFYLIIITILSLSVTSVMPVYAAEELPSMDQIDVAGPSVVVQGDQVLVRHAEGSVLEIYNLAGLKVASYKIDTAEQTIRISLAKGCYILKVGKYVRKISVAS